MIFRLLASAFCLFVFILTAFPAFSKTSETRAPRLIIEDNDFLEPRVRIIKVGNFALIRLQTPLSL